jgi:hypothetical protein
MISVFLLSLPGGIAEILLIIIISVALFLILREVICWYYKINERIRLQIETNNLLKEFIQINKKDNHQKEIKDTLNTLEDNSTEFLQNIINDYEQYSKSDVLTSIYLLRNRGVSTLPVILEKIAAFFEFKSLSEMWIEINTKFKK